MNVVVVVLVSCGNKTRDLVLFLYIVKIEETHGALDESFWSESSLNDPTVLLLLPSSYR
jgi:hypothetical protein